MPHWLNKSLRAFLSLNKSEQRGIIVLVTIILLIALVNLLMPYFVDSKSELDFDKYKSNIESFLIEQKQFDDSVKMENLQNSGEIDKVVAEQIIKPFIFNPNKLPFEDWKKMGFTDRQIRTIKNYEAKGGKFRSNEDLKKMYSISDAEYEVIEPYISIPESNKGKFTEKKIELENIEINSADSSSLIKSLGLSPWLANRVILYREALGGYTNKNQLKEVYGFKDKIYHPIENYIEIDISLIRKIDINNIDFKELLKHPYFDYSTTKVVFDVRNKIGSFSSVDQLKLIDNINDSTFNKIKNYLYIQPLKD